MKHFLLVLFALVSAGAQAQTKMVMHQKAGDDIEIYLSEKPVSTFEDSEMVLTTDNTTLRFPLSNLVSTTFSDVSTSIAESVTTLSPEAGPSCVYDTNGRLLQTIPAGQPVAFGNLPQGLYIVKNNKISYKINKR